MRVRVEGYIEPVVVVGHAATVTTGERLKASGTWISDRTYGRQFRADNLDLSEPTSVEGIEKYLGSGMIHGIGAVYAKKLVAAFGEQVFDVIESESGRLREVEGIGPKRAERIAAAWREQKEIRRIMVFLHSHGIGTARAVRIYKIYGDSAMQIMSEDPYRLTQDIRGIGFKSADAIAMRLGVATEASVRISAGLKYTLSEANKEGHCGLSTSEATTRTVDLLAVSTEQVEAGIQAQLQTKELVATRVSETDCLFPGELYQAEQSIAARIRLLAAGRPPWQSIDSSKALSWVASQLGFTLDESQQQAVRGTLSTKLMIITGGPGVGKTTIVNAILRILAAKQVNIALCAPTGRAAKRMQETTGREAKTIHRLLEADPASRRFLRNASNPLTCDFLVVDESSMVDVPLMQALLVAIPQHAALLIVGDIDQLPSVGPGQVLADIIGGGLVPVRRLTEVFRQAAHSKIITNAHKINIGRMPDFDLPGGATDGDFFFVPTRTPQDAVDKIRRLLVSRIPERFGLDSIRDIQVLCPMRKGSVGSGALNTMLQSALNPPGNQRIERFGWAYVPGDKVMQTENDYEKEVYNGDIGYVVSLDMEAGSVFVLFDGRQVSYRAGELDALAPAYATTIHKSQGSEYPAVVIPLMSQHHIMLQRSLLYTAVTRGRQLVVLVGERSAVAKAVQSASERRRWTKLREWLTTDEL